LSERENYRIDQDGAFAEFVKIPAANIIKLVCEHSGTLRRDLDPLGNAVHTVRRGDAGQRFW